MTLGEIGAFLLVMVIVFVMGQVWFHLVESVLEGIRRRFFRSKEPPAWHPLPEDNDEKKD